MRAYHRSLLLVVLFTLFLGVTCAAEPIKIGISLPLSGPAASYGTDFRNTYLLANKLLANNAYQLIFEDDRCSPMTAVTVAHKLMTIDKVRYVLGVTCDGVFSAAGAIYQSHGAVVISTSSSKVAGDGLFHTNLQLSDWAKQLFEHIAANYHHVGIISEETGFAQDFHRNFNTANDGRLVLSPQTYQSDETDFRPLLLALQAKKVDSLLLLTQTEETLLRILHAVKVLKMPLPIYNVIFAGSKSFRDKSGSDAEGIVFLDFPDLALALNPEGRSIFKQFVTQFGEPQSGEGLFVAAFEAFRAMHQSVNSGQDPRVFLRQTTFSGLECPWHFDSEGFWKGPHMVLKKIDRGQVITLRQ